MAFIFLSAAPVAHAELGDKAPLQVDFNKMIVNTNQKKKALAAGIKKTINGEDTKAAAKDSTDTNRVSNFVDVEIGWGKAPRVVDRRFDSVGAPVVAAIPVEKKRN